MLQGVPEPGLCRNEFGSPQGNSIYNLTLDHVKDDLMMGKKAPDDPDHLWAVCAFHHTGTQAGSQWATHAEVRAAARLYIAAANEYARERGWPLYPSVQEWAPI